MSQQAVQQLPLKWVFLLGLQAGKSAEINCPEGNGQQAAALLLWRHPSLQAARVGEHCCGPLGTETVAAQVGTSSPQRDDMSEGGDDTRSLQNQLGQLCCQRKAASGCSQVLIFESANTSLLCRQQLTGWAMKMLCRTARFHSN